MPETGGGGKGEGSAGRLALALIVVGVFACVGTYSRTELERRHRTTPVVGAGVSIGAGACESCHSSFEDHRMQSDRHGDCEACHGPAQLHAHTAKARDIRYPDNQDCAACHGRGERTLLSWTTSEHERAGVLCSDCHDTHDREPHLVRQSTELDAAVLRHTSGTTQLCASCHAEVAATLNLPSHHPIGEGMLGCTDCHSPHEDRRVTLGARTALCTSCHEAQAGPWIYEHAPVTEDCQYCHTPHGSSAANLLESTQPGACISCHTIAESGAVHDPWAFTTRCTDCHSAVHGSYADPHLRR
jgi:DmsE family decaheme c-type cytochrome